MLSAFLFRHGLGHNTRYYLRLNRLSSEIDEKASWGEQQSITEYSDYDANHT